MKKLLLSSFLFLFLSNPAHGQMTEMSLKALSAYPIVKQYMKASKIHFMKKVGLPVWAFEILAVGAGTLIDGRTDTRRASNLKIKTGNLVIRPDLSYRLHSKEIGGMIFLEFSF